MSKQIMKPDEMQILKAVSIKLDDNTLMIVTQQYHTEKSPLTGKNDKTKSRYRWLARVCDINTLKNAVQEMFSDAHRLEPWLWPNDPSWNGKIYTTDSNKYAGARWLNLRISRTLSWEDGMKVLAGDRNRTGEVNLKAKYDTEDYTADNGDTITLTDRESLLKHVGQNLLKTQSLKIVPHPPTF